MNKLKPMWCSHPELYPTGWNQKKPEPALMVGCIHNYSCTVCGFGAGTHPHDFNCKDKLPAPTPIAPEVEE